MDPLQNQNAAGAGKKSVGPIIGISLIIVILVLGALYFWGSTNSDEAMVPPVSSSDEVSSIEQDLSVGGDFNADFSDIE